MEILNIYTKKLRYHRKAERTIEIYVGYFKEFLTAENIKDPYAISLNQIVDYLENREYSSAPQQNQIIGSLKAFARYVLGRSDVHLKKIERVKKETRLQPVIPRSEIYKINEIKNIKHRTIITIAYGCALRVSEVINLKWKHIDRKEGVIFIEQSKGKKDRIVPVSKNMIRLLEDYYREYKTKTYVFSGQDWRQQYSATSCNNIVKAVFGNQYRFHSLRKSSSTHRYELGDDIGKIQDLLGHKDPKTTRIYVNSTVKSIKCLSDVI